MGVIIFNGISSEAVGLHVESAPNLDIPDKDYDVTHVPGRNGDIYTDKGSYKNAKRSYSVSFGSRTTPFHEQALPIVSWLYTGTDYVRLEDTYDPYIYRMARFNGPANITNLLGFAGRANISFDCKPQRFFKDGDKPIVITEASNVVHNYTDFASLPIILVHGSGTGTFTIGDYTIALSNIDGDVVVDSDLQEVYDPEKTKNLNSTVFIENFPKLMPGDNLVTFSDGVTGLEIIPKWWTI